MRITNLTAVPLRYMLREYGELSPALEGTLEPKQVAEPDLPKDGKKYELFTGIAGVSSTTNFRAYPAVTANTRITVTGLSVEWKMEVEA